MEKQKQGHQRKLTTVNFHPCTQGVRTSHEQVPAHGWEAMSRMAEKPDHG